MSSSHGCDGEQFAMPIAVQETGGVGDDGGRGEDETDEAEAVWVPAARAPERRIPGAVQGWATPDACGMGAGL